MNSIKAHQINLSGKLPDVALWAIVFGTVTLIFVVIIWSFLLANMKTWQARIVLGTAQYHTERGPISDIELCCYSQMTPILGNRTLESWVQFRLVNLFLNIWSGL